MAILALIPPGILFLKIIFIYLFFIFGYTGSLLRHVGSSLLPGLSLVEASWGYSPVVCRLLTAMASLVAEDRLSGSTRAQQLWLPDSRAQSGVVMHSLSCSGACRVFPDQGLNLCLLHWQVDAFPLSHQGSPKVRTF